MKKKSVSTSFGFNGTRNERISLVVIYFPGAKDLASFLQLAPWETRGYREDWPRHRGQQLLYREAIRTLSRECNQN